MVFEVWLAVLSSVFFLVAIYFSLKLASEVKGEKYWVFFVIAALSFGLSHLAGKAEFFGLHGELFFVLHEIGEIVGAFSLAYASYGLFCEMKLIRKKLSA